MSLNNLSLFADTKPHNNNNFLRKEHKVVEFDVWIGKDRHLIPQEIEDEMYALGFTQRTIKMTETISPIDGVNQLEFIQYLGVFDNGQFEVNITFVMKDTWRMLIFPLNSQITVDEGQYYDSKTGMLRLKQLLSNK